MNREPERIRHFFSWFRRRVEHLEFLSSFDVSFEIEQHVLIAAGLDALAGYWARLFAPKLNHDRYRMGEFLVTHADAIIFQRVSTPDLLERLNKRNPELASQMVRHVNSLECETDLRNWRHDRTEDEILADCRREGLSVPAEVVRESRYGELLHRKYRNSWLHELDRHPQMEMQPFDEYSDEPHYSNVIVDEHGRIEKRLVLTPSFLRRAYACAIGSFEAQCLKENRVPSS